MDEFDQVADRPRKGRGSVSNSSSRYEPQRVRSDDGWGSAYEGETEETAASLPTTVTRDTSRTIIAYNDSPDLGFDRSINPYRGCEHGCIYCYARPSHAWLGLSPGLDFETRLFAKFDAAQLLDHELRKPGYKPQLIVLGANTDPYQPVERQYQITRSVIEVLGAFNHPFTIITKSALVGRDIDLLAPLAARNLVRVAISVTSLDRTLARHMEPRAATPLRRLETIQQLSEAGISTTVMTSPMIPGLNDHEMESILEAAKDVGVHSAAYVLLRLPLEIAQLFEEWLHAHVPDRANRVLNLMRSARGGKIYQAEWGKRFVGDGPYAEILASRFAVARKRLALNSTRKPLDFSQFCPPARTGDQMSFAL